MYQIESVSQLPILLLQTPNMNLVNKANPKSLWIVSHDPKTPLEKGKGYKKTQFRRYSWKSALLFLFSPVHQFIYYQQLNFHYLKTREIYRNLLKKWVTSTHVYF